MRREINTKQKGQNRGAVNYPYHYFVAHVSKLLSDISFTVLCLTNNSNGFDTVNVILNATKVKGIFTFNN